METPQAFCFLLFTFRFLLFTFCFLLFTFRFLLFNLSCTAVKKLKFSIKKRK